MIKKIKRKFPKVFASIGKILQPLSEAECFISRAWVSSAHRRLSLVEWGFGNPEFFDHHIDLYSDWLKNKNPLWLERGVFNNLVLKRGGSLMELACGDGFNTSNFYSRVCKDIIALDFDREAIKIAKKKNYAENITFQLKDIRQKLPNKKFDNVIWDAAIEHFTPSETQKILRTIKTRLKSRGILSGYTLIEGKDGKKQLQQHEYEFKDKEDLFKILSPHFNHVLVFETNYPSRDNLYFVCSDDPSKIPFNKQFETSIKK